MRVEENKRYSTPLHKQVTEYDMKMREETKKRIDAIDRGNREQVLATKLAGEEKVEHLTLNQQQRMAELRGNNEVKMQEMAKSLNDFSQKIDHEKKQFAEFAESDRTRQTENFHRQITNTAEKEQTQLKQLDADSHERTAESTQKFDRAEKDNTRSLQQVFQQKDLMHRKRINQNEDSFQKLSSVKDIEHADFIKRKEFEYALEEQRNKGHFQREQAELLRVQAEEIAIQKRQHAEAIGKNHQNFLKKYDEINKTHQEVLSDLEKTTEHDFSKAREALTSPLDFYNTKGRDVFYRSKELNPDVVEKDEHFLIKLRVPEHEKSLYQLMAHNRDLRLTFARNHQDKLTNDEGQRSEYSKVENYTKKWTLPNAVDSSKMVKSYHNGILTFLLPKL
jgi:HSP20 family molecular chaperone IbpA